MPDRGGEEQHFIPLLGNERRVDLPPQQCVQGTVVTSFPNREEPCSRKLRIRGANRLLMGEEGYPVGLAEPSDAQKRAIRVSWTNRA